MGWKERWAYRRGRRRWVETSLRFDADGLALCWCDPAGKGGERRLAWGAVTLAKAFRRELTTGDLLCISFESPAEPSFEIHEEMNGWDDLLQGLPDLLPGCLSSDRILRAVMAPAREVLETTIYRKAAGAGGKP